MNFKSYAKSRPASYRDTCGIFWDYFEHFEEENARTKEPVEKEILNSVDNENVIMKNTIIVRTCN